VVGSLASACHAAVDELASAADLIRWGASRFEEHGLCYAHGTDNAVDEATELVRYALWLEPGIADELLSARLTRVEREQAVELLRRRIVERCPAPYLTHRAWFAGLRFYVDERVLVPRSPIAEWIESGFEPWLVAENVTRVLDLGTGSGCIAIACAAAFPAASIDAVDTSPDALAVALHNVEAHRVAERVRVIGSDLYAELGTRLYDLIVSNPPYVDAREMAALPPEHRHEPRAALASGADGLDCVRRILAGAPAHLAADGVLVVEVGASRVALEAAFPELPLVWLELARGGENVFLLTANDLAMFSG